MPGLQGGGPSLDSLQLKDAPLEPLPVAAPLPPPPNWSRNPCLIPAGPGHNSRAGSSKPGSGDQCLLAMCGQDGCLAQPLNADQHSPSSPCSC